MAASSSAVQVRVLEESAIGVVASGNPKRYRITGESLNQTIASASSKELRADRMTADSIITSGDAGGALNFELSHKTHDMFFEALLASTFTPIGTNGVIAIADATFNSVTHTINSAGAAIPATLLSKGQWFSVAGANTAANNGIYRVSGSTAPTASVLVVDANVKDVVTDAVAHSTTLSSSRLKNGLAALRTFTIEKDFTDVVQNFAFTGMGVKSMALDFKTGSVLGGNFSFLGLKCARSTTSIFPGIGSEVAATTTPVFNSVVGTSVLLNGAPIGNSCANSLSVSVDSALRALRCISSGIGAADLNVGTFKMTMTTELYFSGNTASVYDNMLTGTPISLDICVSDSSGNGMAFIFNRCKIASSEIVAGAIDTDIVMKVTVDATIDSVSNSMIIIDRIGSVA